MSEFQEFPKISRFYEQDVCITEKIDGTNGLICVYRDYELDVPLGLKVKAGSRSRWITPQDDNYGFAKWVEYNADELIELLGEGYHYGEWWGQGIQRRYGMDRKVFSLFNVGRWGALFDAKVGQTICDAVPTLYKGPVTPEIIERYSQPIGLSQAAKKYGFDYENTEGVMMYFTKADMYFKAPLKRGKKDVTPPDNREA